MTPFAALFNKDYQLLFHDVAHQEKFVSHMNEVVAVLRANANDSGCTLHDDLLVWFRNLFFLTEPRFEEAMGELRNDTGLRARMWRIYNLCWAVNQASTVPGDIVDIGCYEAKSTMVFCRYNREALSTKNLYLFDMFDSPPEESRKANHGPQLAGQVKQYMREFQPFVVPGDVTETIPKHLPDHIAFAHIDLNNADAEEHVFKDVYYRLSLGGVVIFDDYGFRRYRASAERHMAFLKDKPEKVLELPTGQGLLIKV